MQDHKTAFRLLVACVLVLAFLAGLSMLVGKSKEETTALSTRALQSQIAALPTTATISTSVGDVTIAFLSDTAPLAVANFARLAESGFYEGTNFHRVIRGFMIQGGDPFSKQPDTTLWGKGGPGYAFADEISGEPMVRGVVAMANSGPNTNGSQFFIVTAAETPWIDGKHTIFARVVSGMEVVDSINGAAVIDTKDHRPVKPVVIQKVVLSN